MQRRYNNNMQRTGMADKKCGNLLSTNMTLCALFEEDAVSIIKDGQFRCGVVIESSEYVSSDEDDGDDDSCTADKLRRGTVRVAWHPEGTEEVVEENTVRFAINLATGCDYGHYCQCHGGIIIWVSGRFASLLVRLLDVSPPVLDVSHLERFATTTFRLLDVCRCFGTWTIRRRRY